MFIWQDVRRGVRMLVKNPGFALVAIVSMAIGVGANAAMFSVADTLVLRPLTASRPGEIVNVTAVVPRTGFTSPTASVLSYLDYLDVRDRTRSFASLAGFQVVVTSFSERPDQPAQRQFGMAASGNLFDMLGVQAILGRSFGIEEDRVASAKAVVVLDYDMWTRQFGADATVLGRVVRIGTIDMTVIGVMPPEFTGPDQFVRPAYYVPLAMLPQVQNGAADALTRRDIRNVAVKGRLRAGVTLDQADQEVRVLGANLQRTYPDTNRNQGLTVRTELGARIAARPPLAVLAVMLMTLALAVLAVACANIAGLLASRAPERAREMALRLAIGAGRPRVIRQLIVESLLLAVSGSVVGLAVGNGLIAIFRRLQMSTDVPLKLPFDLNERVLIVGVAVAAITALVASIVPAWRASRTDLMTTLKSTTAPDAQRLRLWGRNLLVCGQVALSLVLLTMTVFLYRAFQTEISHGPGFRTDRLIMVTFQPELARYDAPRAEAFYRLLADRAGMLPGVRSVALTTTVHLDPISVENLMIAPEGFQLPAGTDGVRVLAAGVDEHFFDTLGIRVIAGRPFRSADTVDAPRVAVVNQTVAARYWPGQHAVGKRFRIATGDSSWTEIIGIAADVKYRALSEGPTEFVYYARAQHPAQSARPTATLLVQTDGDPAALAAPLREMVRTIAPDMPMFDLRTMEDFYRTSALGLGSMLVQTVGGMGGMGLVLSLVGLYGLVAYAASRRTREIGIRMAVGANPGSVQRMVLRHGLGLAVGGSAIGVAASVGVLSLLRGAFPFPGIGVDLSTYLLVVPFVLVLTLVAAFFPARRAARLDPLMALRQD